MAEIAMLPLSCILKTSFSLGYKLYQNLQEKKRKHCYCIEDKFKKDIRDFLTKTYSDVMVFDLDNDILKYIRTEDRPKITADPAFNVLVKNKMAQLIYLNFIPQCRKIVFLTSSPAVAKMFKTHYFYLKDAIYTTENANEQINNEFRDIEIEAKLNKKLEKRCNKFSSIQGLLENIRDKAK